MPILAIIKLASLAAPIVQQITTIISQMNDLDDKSEAEAKAALNELSAATDALYDVVQAKLLAASKR